MRRPTEVYVLIALLLLFVAGVLWYVIDRRSKMRAEPPPAATAKFPDPNAQPEVDLTKHDRKTIDFSSGQPVITNTPEDKAAVDAALKDMQSATGDVTFGPRKPNDEKPPESKP